MNTHQIFFLLFVVAYLSGSIPFGKLIGSRRGIDIQKHGSGNIGFANVVRVLGWKFGFAVLIGDIAKGFIPVIIARQYLNSYQVMAVALAALFGHIFPLWLHFKGGKGVATGLGITLAISPLLGLLGVLIYLFVFTLSRKSAPSSVIATLCLPLVCLVILPHYALFYLYLAFVVLWTHRTNIQQLMGSATHAG